MNRLIFRQTVVRRLMLSLGAAALTTVAVAPDVAQADTHRPHRVYKVCRKSKGVTGLVAGGVAGAVVGGSVIGGGLAGPLIGAAGGALAGRAIDRSITAKKRCRYYSR
ncbi:MAG TPA: hypothetical protein VN222_17900 [Novosphingobium sp.]|nr:hypothetical protein [Novosphingobium sp.]